MYASPVAAAITIHRANPQRCFALIHQTRFNLVDGTADTLDRAAYVLPFVILAFPVVGLWGAGLPQS